MIKLFFLACTALLWVCFCVPLAGAQRTAESALNGYESVAEKATKDWNVAHVNFRKLVAASQDPCDEGVRRALAIAQSALQERTRAWKEFYKQQGQRQEDSKKATAFEEGQLEAEKREAANNVSQWTELLTDLKRRRAALEGDGAIGLSAEDLAKAKTNLDTLITVQEKKVEDEKMTVETDQDAITFAQAAEAAGASDAAVTDSYSQLIDVESTMFASIYRAREIRLKLECRPNLPPPPPPPPEP
jgi:vacuolar-type H+-ATPase subunit I/STV1